MTTVMTAGDRLAADVERIQAAKTWSELEAVCGLADGYYERLPADDDIRRAYEAIKTRHARRVSRTIAA